MELTSKLKNDLITLSETNKLVIDELRTLGVKIMVINVTIDFFIDHNSIPNDMTLDDFSPYLEQIKSDCNKSVLENRKTITSRIEYIEGSVRHKVIHEENKKPRIINP